MSSSLVESSIPSHAPDPYKSRRPPYSEDAEQAVIAAMLMDADAIMRATEYVDDTMFYREGHRRMFRAMVSVSERGEIVDPLTLAATNFRPNERVKLLLSAPPVSSSRTVRAGVRGRFRVVFRVAVGRCDSVVVQAIGARGSRATFHRDAPDCIEP